MFHSDSLDEVIGYVKGGKKEFAEQIDDKLRVVGSLLNEVLTWMHARLQGARDYQTMLQDIISESQTQLDERVASEKTQSEDKKLKAVV